ncbi:hypothetical protein DE146DRAFT_142106 [Phaeosphaeria sp. MPI-PUGE-AT-0046c]|nr:hypothetical protein DE146DRAFT_142106 [Phaeosphaeria sp. MPI-PUGE-AT-0046c]
MTTFYLVARDFLHALPRRLFTMNYSSFTAPPVHEQGQAFPQPHGGSAFNDEQFQTGSNNVLNHPNQAYGPGQIAQASTFVPSAGATHELGLLYPATAQGTPPAGPPSAAQHSWRERAPSASGSSSIEPVQGIPFCSYSSPSGELCNISLKDTYFKAHMDKYHPYADPSTVEYWRIQRMYGCPKCALRFSLGMELHLDPSIRLLPKDRCAQHAKNCTGLQNDAGGCAPPQTGTSTYELPAGTGYSYSMDPSVATEHGQSSAFIPSFSTPNCEQPYGSEGPTQSSSGWNNDMFS